MEKYAYLNDVEKAALRALNGNAVAKEALRKLLLSEIYSCGTLKAGEAANPLKNYSLTLVSKLGQFSNEKVGEQLRATWEGINMLEIGLDRLRDFEERAIPTPFKETSDAV
jgi:hypothetical protein